MSAAMYAVTFREKGIDQETYTAVFLAEDETDYRKQVRAWLLEGEWDVDKRTLCLSGRHTPYMHVGDAPVLLPGDIFDIYD